MNKLVILLVCCMAFIVGCKRWAFTGEAPTDDHLSAAQYNWRLILGYAWPVVLPLLRFVPVVGPPLQAIAANMSWGALATKDQKALDK